MTMPMATGRPSTEDSGISFLRGPRHTVICSPAGRRARARGWERDWGDPASGSMSARSEEQTSELPSLMRIPYAVFRLYKKTITQDISAHRHTHGERNIQQQTKSSL